MAAKDNFTTRMARWSARHRKIAVFGWLGFVVVALVAGALVGTKTIDPDTSMPGEAGRAEKILDEGFRQPAHESVIVQSDTYNVNHTFFRNAVADVVAKLDGIDSVTAVSSPLDPGNVGQISESRHAALVQFDIRGDADKAMDKVAAVEAAVADVQRGHRDFYIAEFGDASADKALDDAFAKDLEQAGLLSLPITLAILLVVFGALVAAGIPLLLALSAVMATIGLLAFPSHLMPVDEQIGAVILLIGLAVGVDYTMFYLKREREERANGHSEERALEIAAATSGRAVLISGLTVMIAMAGMFFAGDQTFSSFALGTIIVVAIAVVGSLTVLPAMLSKLGDNVNRLRIPGLGRLTRPSKGEGMWGAIVNRVLRRPALSAAVAAGVLIAMALPVLTMKTVVPGAEAMPRSIEVMNVYDRIQAEFPGEQLPATVVVKGDDVKSPAMEQAVAELEEQALASGRMHNPITVDVNADATVMQIAIPIDGTGTDEPSKAALAELRDRIVPDTVGAVAGAESAVTGTTAISEDFNSQMRGAAPIVFAFVLTFAFLLLLVSFRSIVIAVKAIVLNLLSVAAAYGVLVLVFQHGIGKDLLGFDYTGGVMAFLPMFLFVILFGLSMDYHVFILSRVREAYDRGMKTDEAVSYGIKATAGVVTSAAVVMVFVFAVFATLSMVMLKQFGVGLAVAVAIDATIVRAVLLPASMKLLGDWNWYLPSWLEWLPRLEHEPEPAVREEVAEATA